MGINSMKLLQARRIIHVCAASAGASVSNCTFIREIEVNITSVVLRGLKLTAVTSLVLGAQAKNTRTNIDPLNGWSTVQDPEFYILTPYNFIWINRIIYKCWQSNSGSCCRSPKHCCSSTYFATSVKTFMVALVAVCGPSKPPAQSQNLGHRHFKSWRVFFETTHAFNCRRFCSRRPHPHPNLN